MPEVDNDLRDLFGDTPTSPQPEKSVILPGCLTLLRSSLQVPHEDPLKDVRVDLTKDYPPLDFLLTRNGVGCIPRGDIQGLGGKMKNGKTTAGLCMIVAMLKGEFAGFKATRDTYKCLIVDTEQSIINAAEKAKMLHGMLGWPEKVNIPRLQSVSLRNKSREERAEYLAKSIEIERPDFVLLDGAVDICGDFNNTEKSRDTLDFLMKLSETCAIMCVLHTNKTDNELRGHLGAEILNKCSETYIVSKTNDVATVTQTVCRNAPISDWAFSIGENGVPEAAAIISKADEKKDKLREVFAEIFREKGGYSYTELCEKCMEKFNVKIDMARKKVSAATENGIISKDESGIYRYGDFPDIEHSDDVPQSDENDIFRQG